MEKINVKRVFGTAEFAGSGKGYGLKVGKRYTVSIAYLDTGAVQVHVDDTADALCFIDYKTQNDFELEWGQVTRTSKKKYFEGLVGL